MGVTAAIPVLDKSADTSGISTMTAAKRLGDTRSGVLYDPVSLAGITPVHCHPLAGGRYLILFSQRWHTATVSTTDPGGYTAHSVDHTPGWVIATVPTGVRILPKSGYSIPCTLDHDSFTLTGAVSRASDYLYMSYSIVKDSQTYGAVSHWWVNTSTDSLLPLAEELVPGTDQIVFDRGLWYSTPYLVVVGAHTDTNEMYFARKPWARIGSASSTAVTLDGFASGGAGLPSVWEYSTGTGWSTDITEASPVVSSTGDVITTTGPVSTCLHVDRTFMSTVVTTDALARRAAVYQTRGGSRWTSDGEQVPLGSAASYLGGTLQFQQQLTASSMTGEMNDSGNMAALPYVVSSLTSSGGIDRLENTWSVWPVARGQGSGVAFMTLDPVAKVVGLTGSAPRIVLPKTISPTGATLALVGKPPGNTLIPARALLTLTGYAPFVGNVTTLTPAAASATLAGSAPTVRPGTNLRPAALAPTLTGAAPTITIASAGTHISDTFNRANSSSVGSNWTNRLTNPMGILSNQSYVVTDVTDALITHNTVMLTDNHKISVVAAPQAGMLADFVSLVIGAKADGSEYASLLMYASYNPGDGSTNPVISTGNGWTGTDTARSTAATYTGFTTGDVISLERTGNVYTAKKNGTTLVTWTDGSNVLPRDSSHRLVGLYAYRYISGGTNFYDVRYDSFTADDI